MGNWVDATSKVVLRAGGGVVDVVVVLIVVHLELGGDGRGAREGLDRDIIFFCQLGHAGDAPMWERMIV